MGSYTSPKSRASSRTSSHLTSYTVRALSTTLILMVGLINLMPVAGVASAARLQALYGVAVADANLLNLMRHRAVLLGIVGGLLGAAALHPPLRPVGFAVGLISMLSFVLVAWGVGSYNAELRRVLLVDVVASVLLVGAALLDYGARTRDDSG